MGRGTGMGIGGALLRATEVLPSKGGSGSSGLRLLGFGSAWARRWIVAGLENNDDADDEVEGASMADDSSGGGGAGGRRRGSNSSEMKAQLAVARALLLPPAKTQSVGAAAREIKAAAT